LRRFLKVDLRDGSLIAFSVEVGCDLIGGGTLAAALIDHGNVGLICGSGIGRVGRRARL